ncbi:oxysterol-binding protein-related protein 2-like isoform X2 [Oncorhynchus keta]|uniref:oxysterol-binding protein-related protein 2-like isoform X2 n=1 Tax=Oncorhynchus keta TaxID=8018 RepID=UPI0015F7BE7D|nr:oxysterol-binding protein-related protein 2-like isoform X2 [Oncorhynchus keta]
MNNDDEFYDAVTGLDSDESYEGTSEASFKDALVYDGTQRNNGSLPQENGIRKHRTTLPAPMFSRNNFSVWGILKKCIGLELSKITMPIVFNEPLSFLQRITEYMEHTYLINKACSLSDSIERMQAVAAFAVSAVASQWDRTGKPFNPLLGETYELTREDHGYRLISEQVSHHPPISAFHAESLVGDFVFHGSIYPKLKFWGKSVEAEPKGTITLELLKHGEVYTWTNPFCCVHNVILGKLWIEQYGTVEILNHSTGDKCVLNFKPCGMFGKELHRVEGYIQDKSKKKHCVIYGKWTECMWSVDPQTYEANKKAEKKGDSKKPKSQVEPEGADNDDADDMPEVQETVAMIPGSTLLWRISSRPQHSAKMYNFTNFAMSLNELEPGMQDRLAPTDCRLRPDIRAMENGDMDEASREKARLEEKQRSARKDRSKDEEEWSTRWFQSGTNPYTSSQDWLYTGGYFDRNYSELPVIY